MASITTQVVWHRGEEKFTDNRYSRAHRWTFDGGAEVAASSSPDVVPVPMSDPSAIDPEEAFVASLSSCHMLWFLAIAAKRRFVVNSYEDDASGLMAKNGEGQTAITVVTLQPRISFDGDNSPTSEELAAMHHEAHDKCFIANSVKTEVRIESDQQALGEGEAPDSL